MDDRTPRTFTTTRRIWSLLPLIACGLALAPAARAADDAIERALVEGGKTHYQQYCTPCHGAGGAPGTVPADLRTYVARHGGKFPAADWLAVIVDARPGSVHEDAWERIQRDYGATANASAAARATVAEIARYVRSIQSQ